MHPVKLLRHHTTMQNMICQKVTSPANGILQKVKIRFQNARTIVEYSFKCCF